MCAVPAINTASRLGDRCCNPWCGRSPLKERTFFLLLEHTLQMPLAEDEEMIQAFPAYTS